MFKHEKQLFHPVEIEKANPQYAAFLQEQLGGANGELKAAMQYMSQSFRIKDPEIKDLFLDIAAEELGHMGKWWHRQSIFLTVTMWIRRPYLQEKLNPMYSWG